MIVFKCGQCGAKMAVPPNLAGKMGKCPKCGTLSRLPLAGSLTIHPAFAGESAIVQRLVQDRPRFWEYSLTAELLKPHICELSKSLDDACAGMSFRKNRTMSLEEYLQWSHSRLDELMRILEIMRSVVENGFLLAWGPPGQPGDAVEIKRVVAQFVSAGQAIVEWEAERVSVVPPESLQMAHNLSAGWAKEIFLNFRNIPSEIESVMTIPGDHEIVINVRTPDLEPFKKEFEKGCTKEMDRIKCGLQTIDDPPKVDRPPDSKMPPTDPHRADQESKTQSSGQEGPIPGVRAITIQGRIALYETEDGKRFWSKEEAIAHLPRLRAEKSDAARKAVIKNGPKRQGGCSRCGEAPRSLRETEDKNWVCLKCYRKLYPA